eukprot:GEMP01098963.1.p1 GENE.GEMP01098963.1~~GEMP01098963.1.p1  ORF type:complete len:151 (+),score=19.59 GEMP01098963.1:181-633(+)
MLSVFWLSFLAAATDLACRSKGFGSNLSCLSCDRLFNHLQDKYFQKTGVTELDDKANKLLAECRSCCQEDRTLFEKAVLSYDPSLLAKRPDLHDFVTHKAKRFAKLTLKEMKHGYATSLKLSSQEETVTHRVSEWKSDQIRDFLQLKLQS